MSTSPFEFALPLAGASLPAYLAAVWGPSEDSQFIASIVREPHAMVFYTKTKASSKAANVMVSAAHFRRGREGFRAASTSSQGVRRTLSEAEFREALASLADAWLPQPIRDIPEGYVHPRARGLSVAPPPAAGWTRQITKESRTLDGIDSDASREVEQKLGFRFPAGWDEFMREFGECLVSGFVRLYPPQRVLDGIDEWRERVTDYFFWEAEDDEVPPLDHCSVIESVVIGDTVNGDEFLVHPDDPAGIYVLPRDDGEMVRVAGNLRDLLEWVFGSGKLVERKSRLSVGPA